MKNRRNYILGILLGGASILLMGCVNSLLDQIPTTELGNTEFWQTEEDATNGLMGAYVVFVVEIIILMGKVNMSVSEMVAVV